MRTKVSNKSFKDSSFFIGIDTHKKNWKVTILGDNYEHKVMNQNPDPAALADYLKRNFPGANYQAVYEAGFSGFTACRQLNQLGIDCKVIHPADVPSSHKEKIQKNDKADSRKLAKMLRANSLEGIHIPEPKLEADRALIRLRFKMVKDLGRTKNRVKSLLFQFGIQVPEHFTESQTRHWSNAYTIWLKQVDLNNESLRFTLDTYIETALFQRKQILSISKKIRHLAKTDDYNDNYQILLSVPGIATTGAMTFLLQIGDIRRFKVLDELCNYIGLVPSMHGSGEKMSTGKIVNRGRKELKIMLIEASWIAIRMDPALMAKFNELTKRMNKNKAIIRIARKILSRMRYVLMHQQKYQMGIVE